MAGHLLLRRSCKNFKSVPLNRKSINRLTLTNVWTGLMRNILDAGCPKRARTGTMAIRLSSSPRIMQTARSERAPFQASYFVNTMRSDRLSTTDSLENDRRAKREQHSATLEFFPIIPVSGSKPRASPNRQFLANVLVILWTAFASAPSVDVRPTKRPPPQCGGATSSESPDEIRRSVTAAPRGPLARRYLLGEPTNYPGRLRARATTVPPVRRPEPELSRCSRRQHCRARRVHRAAHCQASTVRSLCSTGTLLPAPEIR